MLLLVTFYQFTWESTHQTAKYVWIAAWVVVILLAIYILRKIRNLSTTTKFKEARCFMLNSLNSGFTLEKILQRFGDDLRPINCIIKTNPTL